jgi:hypothetical protein
MALVVNGTAADRAAIETMLRQICASVRVDAKTGAVDLNLTAVGRNTGCDCLRDLIASKRTVTVEPLPKPSSKLPGDTTEIKDGGGGLTTRPPGSEGTVAKPGKGPDGDVGSDCTVGIDMSNNGGKGYPDPLLPGRPLMPLWLILAHELTTGHASHNTKGTAAATSPAREAQAQASENAHREAHNLPLLKVP